MSQGEAPALQIQRLSVWLGPKQVLKQVSLEVPKRCVFTIMGPSGSGKSTLLRCINRLIELQHDARVEGSILLDGADVFSMSPLELRRRVGLIFQIPNPFPHMSIYDNVAFALRVNGIARGEGLRRRVEEALRKAALWDEVKEELGKKASRLSGGQQQRLCIARALALNPEVIMMDEPTSAVDPVATSKIEALMRELKQEYTVILVTHVPQQAARVSDFIAFLYGGEVVEVGEAAQLFTSPRHRLTELYVTGRVG